MLLAPALAIGEFEWLWSEFWYVSWPPLNILRCSFFSFFSSYSANDVTWEKIKLSEQTSFIHASITNMHVLIKPFGPADDLKDIDSS